MKDEDAEKRTPLPGEPRGWYSRGYLPHFDQPGLVQSIIIRLADSLPASKLTALEQLLESLPENDRALELRRRIESLLDAGYGECHLRDPRIALMVETALLHFDGNRYRLLAWVIMPNHAHIMVQTLSSHRIEQITHSWKSFTAKRANQLLDRQGTFWMKESFDRFIRNQAHFDNAVRYIHQNPVKAGLVKKAEDWPYGSARLKR